MDNYDLPPIPPTDPTRPHCSGKYAHHFGKVELRHFLDWLYDGPPKSKEEELK